MLDGKQGAAFVVGASTLTDADQESVFSKLFHEYLLEEDQTVGSAMIKAKQEFAKSKAGRTQVDILWGITLLGDPLLSIH
jgi:hypothetical protein